MSERMTITGADSGFDAYVARPSGDGPWPAVVVIQEIFGVNATMRGVADDLAREGWLAVVPDLFWRFEPGVELDDNDPEQLQQAFSLFPRFDVNNGVEDIRATIDAVRSRPDCSGKVGVVGYCLGGSLAYLTATRTDVDATVSYYGISIPDHLDEATQLKTPLLLHVAEQDRFVPLERQAQIVAALGDHPLVDIPTYAGRDHAFARKGGENYHAEDAERADGRTRAFFRAHLG